jgi:hypothetical protein
MMTPVSGGQALAEAGASSQQYQREALAKTLQRAVVPFQAGKTYELEKALCGQSNPKATPQQRALPRLRLKVDAGESGYGIRAGQRDDRQHRHAAGRSISKPASLKCRSVVRAARIVNSSMTTKLVQSVKE